MSNPLDSIVETLSHAEPRPEAVERAVASLRRPHPPRLVPLAVGVAALSAVALWPRPGSGLAWAQVAAQDLPLRYHEVQGGVVDGTFRLNNETWVDRAAGAFRTDDLASVDRRFVRERFQIVEKGKSTYHLFNGVGAFSRKGHHTSGFDPRNAAQIRQKVDLEGVLKTPNFRQTAVDRNVDSRLGRVDRYRLERIITPEERRLGKKLTAFLDHPLTVFVQPGGHRVLGYDAEYRDGKSQTTIEYPDRFPADTFAIPPHNGEHAYDLDAIDAAAKARLRTPLATLRVGGQTAQLRLVVQGAKHALWTLWTGAKPNGDLAERVQVLGIPNGHAYGLAGFTSKSSSGGPYGGHAVQLDRKVEKVDLRIPVFAKGTPRSRLVGYAVVRGVPVLQVSDIEAVWSVLGVRSPIR